ncbi:GDSL-type esterase/lipase family protein [Corynebacterium alimapuense]|uniref:Hydrolase n=1 Tax=Corynebacterium alimapuense TaxID=1576874 RepID=A0A3M8K8A6_9CORY|nr:GDSL-type esterase/lipase family protein [Corynebacterium alimapuense]RNE48995.1 hydrolase [Corynebacterium alimapuense]
MSLNRLLSRAGASLAAAMLALSGIPAATAVGSAPVSGEEGTMVIFGDSVSADPPLGIYLADKLSSQAVAETVAPLSSQEGIGVGSVGVSAGTLEGHCPSSLNSYGIRTAEALGLEAVDFSCNGASVLAKESASGDNDMLVDQVDEALAEGTLDSNTERILITMGLNDTYSQSELPEEEVKELFVAAASEQVSRIQEQAPQARIQIVGYASITDGEYVCLVHGPGVDARVAIPQVGAWESMAQDMQQRLATTTGTEFVDLKPSTANAHLCSPDDQRMWTSISDASSGRSHQPVHLNQRGHEHVAEVLIAS